MSVAARLLGFAEGDFHNPFAEAIDFLRQKIRIPTSGWRDLQKSGHDRGFAVAGATRDGLLADLMRAIDDAIAKGETLDQFRKKFDQAVAKHGWTGWTGEGTEEGRVWRTRVIYETNLRTAYAAGRYRQMKDPDVLKLWPYWMYKHADLREPERPRYEHAEIWNGLVLMHDDPWWDTHYPPNGWNCTCGVRNLTERMLKALGKSGPDKAPPITYRDVRDPKTGRNVKVPNGIDLGWDYAPGQSWARGVTPRELPAAAPANPLKPPSVPLIPATAPKPDIASLGRPFKAPLLPDGLSEEAYANRFLGEFGAKIGQPVLYRDKLGEPLVISDDLFRNPAGELKITKRGRQQHLLRLAETIKDPDEIWLDEENLRSGGKRIVRRYIRVDQETGGLSVFEWVSGTGWRGVTTFSAQKGTTARPDLDYLETQRRGVNVYRRAKE